MLSNLASRGTLRVAAFGASCFVLAALAQSIDVRVVQPERRDITRVSGQPATAEAMHEADIGSKVSGQVTELNVDIGSRVSAGEVLARIAVPELIQARNAAEARVVAMRSAYERTTELAERNSITQRALVEAKSRLDTAI